MAAYRVAFIGSGGRSVCYGRAYAAHDDVEVAAIADPNGDHRRVLKDKAGLSGPIREFDDWREMISDIGDDIDGVVIATPNYLHHEPAVACLEMGLPIALEKPLAHNKAACEHIVDTERATSGRSLIGFVLRSTPFYSKIHELIASGAIGQIISIQADELPGWGVSSVMNRNPWRRYTATSGGALLEKSCHDMDMLTWMMGARPTALCSFGRRMIFNPNPSLPERCEGCGVAAACKYYKEPPLANHEDPGEQVLVQFVREEDRCIYNIDKDVVDTQSVTIEYESGAVANFMMNFNCDGPQAGRNFHAVGTKGRIWGNMQTWKVVLHKNETGQTIEFDVAGDGSGHGGGDKLHALELLKMMQDPEYVPEQNAAAGYLSAAMCFAADLSRQERRRVEFAYTEGGYIDFVF